MIFLFFFILAVCGAGPVFAQDVDDLTFITEDYPPYNYVENGKLQGFGVDILVAMLEELNAKTTRDDIQVLAWAKGYQLTQEHPNNVLFVTSRTPGRENLFQWVGPMGSDSMVLIGLKERAIHITSDDQLNKFYIGAVRDDAGDILLQEKGLKSSNIDRSDDPKALATKLTTGRIDLWSYDEPTAYWLCKRWGLDSSRFETVYKLNDGEIYYAVSLGTPTALVQKLQQALDSIKQPGLGGEISRFNQIMDKYR